MSKNHENRLRANVSKPGIIISIILSYHGGSYQFHHVLASFICGIIWSWLLKVSLKNFVEFSFDFEMALNHKKNSSLVFLVQFFAIYTTFFCYVEEKITLCTLLNKLLELNSYIFEFVIGYMRADAHHWWFYVDRLYFKLFVDPIA